MDIGLGLIFLAGFVSFASPCVLSLLPVYMGLLGGSLSDQSDSHHFQRKLLARVIAFILGFTLVFILLGFTTTLIGTWLFDAKNWIARIAGLAIILFGLQTIGVVTIPFFNQERLVRFDSAGNGTFLGSFLMGVGFSAGWSPCIGPILGSILTMMLAVDFPVLQGVIALLVYSAGMAVPFLLISFGLGQWLKRLRSNYKVVRFMQIGAGVLMVIMGVLLFLGFTSRLSQLGNWVRF